MRSRGVFLALVGIASLCIISCALIFLVALPRSRDKIEASFREAVSTQVASAVAVNGATAQPGTYTISAEELRNEITDRLKAQSDNIQDLVLTITEQQIEIGFKTQGQNATYTGRVAAENGKLVVRDLSSNSAFLDFFFPSDQLASAVEDGVNQTLAAEGLQLQSVAQGEGVITLTVTR